ncbi:hypothetical protein ZWY2020_051790 [Hordeum vulgare]|nr:hypothetical protein ZWY2020_051790 [Hordeum vulgare]
MTRRRHAVVVVLFLVILASSAAATEEERGSVGAMMRQTLGSRPPSCEGQCRWMCGGRRCVAVQVPVTPRDLEQQQQLKKKKKTKKEMEKTTSPAAGRGGGGAAVLPSSYDDHSNYKPLGWRCKCLHS